MTQLIWSFAPWIVFLLSSRVGSAYEAVAAGLLTGVVVLVRAFLTHRVHMLDIVSVGYFAALGVALVLVHPYNSDTWGRYGQAGSHAALTFIIFGSILVGHSFTESYAREQTPENVWHTTEFRAVNRQITLAWGLAFLVGTISLVVAAAIDELPFVLRILIPFGALYLAYNYTQEHSRSAGDAVRT